MRLELAGEIVRELEEVVLRPRIAVKRHDEGSRHLGVVVRRHVETEGHLDVGFLEAVVALLIAYGTGRLRSRGIRCNGSAP